MKTQLVMPAMLLLMGCSSTTNWVGGISEQQFYQDRYLCQMQASSAAPSAPAVSVTMNQTVSINEDVPIPMQVRPPDFSGVGAKLAAAQAQNSLFESCLYAKGYQKAPK